MPRKPRSGSGAGLGVGAVLLIVACCAGPALIGGGALAVVGRVLGRHVVVGAGLVIALGGIAIVLARRARGQANCCDAPPKTGDPDPLGRQGDHRN